MPNKLVVGKQLMLGRPHAALEALLPWADQVADPIAPTVQIWTGPSDAAFDYGMLGNGPDPSYTINGGQPVGDCGFAMFTHADQVVAMLEVMGVPAFTANQVVKAYFAYNHGKDVGVVLADLCHTLYVTGILGVRLAGYVAGRGAVEDEVTGITQHCGVSFCGIMVSQSMEDAFNSADPKNVFEYKGTAADRDILGGHAVPTVAFDLGDGTIDIITWARRMRWTIETLEHYLDEHWAPIYPQVKAKNGIDGFDWDMLDALLAKVGPGPL